MRLFLVAMCLAFACEAPPSTPAGRATAAPVPDTREPTPRVDTPPLAQAPPLWLPPRVLPTSARLDDATGALAVGRIGDRSLRLSDLEQRVRALPRSKLAELQTPAGRQAFLEDTVNEIRLGDHLQARFPPQPWERVRSLASITTLVVLDRLAEDIDPSALEPALEAHLVKVAQPEKKRALRVRFDTREEAEKRVAVLRKASPDERRRDMRKGAFRGVPARAYITVSGAEQGPLDQAILSTPLFSVAGPVEEGGAWWIAMPVSAEPAYQPTRAEVEWEVRYALAQDMLEPAVQHLLAALMLTQPRNAWVSPFRLLQLSDDDVKPVLDTLDTQARASGEARIREVLALAELGLVLGLDAHPLAEKMRSARALRAFERSIDPVDPAAVKSIFEKDPQAFARPERRRFLVFRFESQGKATQAYEALRALEGQPVALRRKLQSLQVEQNAALLPYVSRAGEAGLEVSETVRSVGFELPADGISQPVREGDAWLVIHVSGVRAGKPASMDEARPYIEQKVMGEQREAARKSLERDAWSNVEKAVNLELLEQLRLPVLRPHHH